MKQNPQQKSKEEKKPPAPPTNGANEAEKAEKKQEKLSPEEEKKKREAMIEAALAAAFGAEQPSDILFDQVLKGELDADVAQSIQHMVIALDKTDDPEEQARTVREMESRGVISKEVSLGFFGAMMRENMQFRMALGRSRRELGTLSAELGNIASPEKEDARIYDTRGRLLNAFSREAGRLAKQYPAGIPEAELERIRGALQLFDRRTTDFIRGRMGSSLLLRAEARDAQAADRAAGEILSRLEVLFGNDQRALMNSAYRIYQIAYRDAREDQTQDTIIQKTRNLEPRANMDTMYRIARAGRMYLIKHAELAEDERKEIAKDIALLEDMVLRFSREDEVKDDIRNTRFREREEALFARETAQIFSIDKEVIEKSTVPAGELLRSYKEETAARLRQTAGTAYSQNPLYPETREFLRQILSLDRDQRRLTEEEEALRVAGEPEQPRISPAQGVESEYTPAKLVVRMEQQESQWKQELAYAQSANDTEMTRDLQERLNLAHGLLRGDEQIRNYLALLDFMRAQSIISPEEFRIAADLLEARAKYDELQARKMGDHAEFLKSMDPERLSPKERQKRENDMARYARDAERLFQLAEDRRAGKIF